MTLLEVGVWIAIFSIVMVAVMNSILYFYRTNNYTIEQASAVTSAQRGIDRAVREIREAAYAANGAYPVVSFGANDFVFYSDIDSDSAAERVHFFLSTSGGLESFTRGILNPSGDPPVYTGQEATSSISEYVRNTANSITTFIYYDKNGAQITDYTKIADVRFVSVNLGIDVDPNRSPTPLSLRSSAALRNLIGK